MSVTRYPEIVRWEAAVMRATLLRIVAERGVGTHGGYEIEGDVWPALTAMPPVPGLALGEAVPSENPGRVCFQWERTPSAGASG